MNGFASMNGIAAARAMQGGMAGSVRAARPTPQAWNPQQPAPSGGYSEPSGPGDGIMGHGGGGMLNTKSHGGAAQYITSGQPLVGGVNSGPIQGPVLQQPPPQAFDPNDPNNAALAGYMRG